MGLHSDTCACGRRACAWVNGVGYCHPCSLPPVRSFLRGASITFLPTTTLEP